MPNTNTDTNADQFFVVQDDGTLLINRQVQYVAQVQDVKEVLDNVQPVCTVYDVSSQQFFVDVDNSAELISVSDEFTLADAENGLYNNSYLLQPASSTTEEQMDEDIKDHRFEESPQVVDINQMAQSTRQTTGCTEITLSDEQYQILERNGWILLESNDKIFVLDTLGLHDITENYKLIQKLKHEIQSTNTGLEAGYVKIENIQAPLPNLVVQPLVEQREPVQLVIGVDEHEEGSLQRAADEKESLKSETEKFDVELQPRLDSLQVERERGEAHTGDKCLKIKTKLTFRDIPDKILLGKSISGKNIVASVVKRQPLARVGERAARRGPPGAGRGPACSVDCRRYRDATETYEPEFINLIQQYGRGRGEGTCTPEDVGAAAAVVARLAAAPGLRDQILGHRLVVTKVAHVTDESGALLGDSGVAMVTGRAALSDGAHVFQHEPDMLQKIKNTPGGGGSAHDDDLYKTETDARDFTVLHIHITQTTCNNNVTVSVNLNKRRLPVSLQLDARRRHPRAVFACGACAALFESEEVLKEHRESGKCSDADDVLMIDSDKFYIGCTMLRGQKEKVYVCTLCEAQFSKLNNCYRHVQTHAMPIQQEADATDSSKQREDCKEAEVYRCKMCPSTYLFASSLSKHIVARHININKT